MVDRGKGDGVFVNTAGVGVVEHGLAIAPRSVRPGDAIILSGDIGRIGTSRVLDMFSGEQLPRIC